MFKLCCSNSKVGLFCLSMAFDVWFMLMQLRHKFRLSFTEAVSCVSFCSELVRQEQSQVKLSYQSMIAQRQQIRSIHPSELNVVKDNPKW